MPALYADDVGDLRRRNLTGLGSEPALLQQKSRELCRQLHAQLRVGLSLDCRVQHDLSSGLAATQLGRRTGAGSVHSGRGSSLFSRFFSFKLRSRNSRARSCPPNPNAIAKPSMNAPKIIENAAITVCLATPTTSKAIAIASAQITKRIDQLTIFGDG